MIKIQNPATREIIRELEEDGPSSIEIKYKQARAAQRDWAAAPIAVRKAAVAKFRELLQSNTESLALLLTREMGKPISQARGEIKAVDGRIDFFLNNVDGILNEEKVFQSPAMNESITHEPLGVIANISAWNYPYFVGSNVFVPALLTGNAVLFKPSEFSLLSGLEMARLLHQAGIPQDVFIPIVGSGLAGQTLIAQPVDGVFFTGSYATGVKIAVAAAPKLIKVQLELGGKDPTYVCEDADPAVAAGSLADGAMYNTGQSCCSVERIYVNEKIYDAFVEQFVRTVEGFKSGSPESEDTYVGAITREGQLGILERQIADARTKGAHIRVGSGVRKGTGNFFEPTVAVNVNHTMELMRDESFGPVIGIQKVKDDTEAIKLMNDTEFGLTAGVYGGDETRARKIMSQVDSGTSYWNCCDRVSPRLPWTGRRHSGIGSTLSLEGIRTFLRPRAWHLKRP